MTNPQRQYEATPLPAHAPGAILRVNCEYLGVLVTHDWRRLVAIRPIAAGTKIFMVIGRDTPTPTRHSIQVARDVHVDQDDAHDPAEAMRRYFWRFMDHACDPNTVIRGRSVIARRDIASGETVSFNYNTTEYELAEPFRCRCESALCIGLVRGARHLTPGQRALIEDLLAEYLR
jgi:hypothetical protein